MAFLLPYLFPALKWMIGFDLSAGFDHPIAPPWLQRLVILCGILWSVWAIRKLSQGKSLIVFVVHGALVLAFGLTLILLVGT
jgi:hypothetical protein